MAKKEHLLAFLYAKERLSAHLYWCVGNFHMWFLCLEFLGKDGDKILGWPLVWDAAALLLLHVSVLYPETFRYVSPYRTRMGRERMRGQAFQSGELQSEREEHEENKYLTLNLSYSIQKVMIKHPPFISSKIITCRTNWLGISSWHFRFLFVLKWRCLMKIQHITLTCPLNHSLNT